MKKILKYLFDWWRKATKVDRKATSTAKKLKNEYNVMERRRIVLGVRRFFEHNYELRYNVMKQTEEFREKPTHRSEEATQLREESTHFGEEAPQWRQLTDREFRKMAIEQMEQVGAAWSIDVELYLRSALIHDYSPIADYLSSLPAWDGSDHIRQLAQRVPCAFPEWPEWFHRWFLAMVAQWQQRSRDYGNSVVPMLIGAQGTHKSTFSKLLLPPSLREYYIDDIKLDAAEQVERMISRMLLVNIDEYNAKTDREQAKIKRVLTERDVQTRKMRSDQYLLLPRMASFIATTNEREPLTDSTGSRRYLCCEVTSIIDTDTPIDYPQLYAQAVSELEQGMPWYFSKEEELQIERHNQQYQCQSSVETVLLTYFEPAPRSKENFIRAVDIQQHLRQHLSPTDVPNIKKLTIALKKCHFFNGKMDGVRGWYAYTRSTE